MIIAVDFDGTIVEHDYPEIGAPKKNAIKTLKDLQKAGHLIIIWTCRCEPYLSPMTKYLNDNGFYPDAVNANLGSVRGMAMPKIFANMYIDDKNFPPFPGWNWVRTQLLC